MIDDAHPADVPDPLHLRPDGVSDDAVTAVGKMNEAVELIERARGHLYAFHQMTGYADEILDDVVDGLTRTGHREVAARITEELIGLNVIAGRWSFQVVEEYDDGYYRAFRDLDRAVRDAVVGGRRHVMEAETKERRRTRGRPGHEARPSGGEREVGVGLITNPPGTRHGGHEDLDRVVARLPANDGGRRPATGHGSESRPHLHDTSSRDDRRPGVDDDVPAGVDAQR